MKELTIGEEQLLNEGLILADFFAPWCSPCKKLAPVLEQIAEEFEGKVAFIKVNVEEHAELARKYSVSGLPTLLTLNRGVEVDRIVGLKPKSSIESNLLKLIVGNDEE